MALWLRVKRGLWNNAIAAFQLQKHPHDVALWLRVKRGLWNNAIAAFQLQIKWASGGSIAHGPVGVHGYTGSPRLAPPVSLWSLGSKSRLLGRALRLLVVAGGDPNGASSCQANRERPRIKNYGSTRDREQKRVKASKNE